MEICTPRAQVSSQGAPQWGHAECLAGASGGADHGSGQGAGLEEGAGGGKPPVGGGAVPGGVGGGGERGQWSVLHHAPGTEEQTARTSASETQPTPRPSATLEAEEKGPLGTALPPSPSALLPTAKDTVAEVNPGTSASSGQEQGYTP